jgi:hypothetical protein
MFLASFLSLSLSALSRPLNLILNLLVILPCCAFVLGLQVVPRSQFDCFEWPGDPCAAARGFSSVIPLPRTHACIAGISRLRLRNCCLNMGIVWPGKARRSDSTITLELFLAWTFANTLRSVDAKKLIKLPFDGLGSSLS